MKYVIETLVFFMLDLKDSNNEKARKFEFPNLV